jgi:hypothetical protein
MLDAPLCIWDAKRDEVVDGEESGEGGKEVVAGPEREVAGLKSCGGGGGGHGEFGFVGEMRARWSDHYKENPRDPDNTEFAWWVKGAMRGAKA